jgi:hypothetical protein
MEMAMDGKVLANEEMRKGLMGQCLLSRTAHYRQPLIC